MSRADLAEANYLGAAARVAPGQRLLVPRAPAAALLTGRTAETMVAARAEVLDDEPAKVVYRVRKGDTLFAIARRHSVSVENLRAWNKLRGSVIAIGDRLQIHTTRAANAQ